MRKLRVDFANARHHVTSRIMADLGRFTAQEHLFIQRVLEDAVGRYPVRLHAYCIMPNHLHLVVESIEAVLSRFMKTVKQRIAQFINRTRKRSGPVFQQRFHNVLIEDDAHWMHVLAYVHLNPVPSVVDAPAAYAWSSHGAYAQTVATPEWLTTETMVKSFGSTARLLQYVEEVRVERHHRLHDDHDSAAPRRAPGVDGHELPARSRDPDRSPTR
jgi:REP element-mobilizing transposase RayT